MRTLNAGSRLGVIVITLNEEAGIRQVLRQITRFSGLEELDLVVVDGGSTDRTVEIAGEFADVVRSSPGRASQMARGLKEVSSDVILFCHGDTLVPEGFGRSVLRACGDPAVVGGSFRPVYQPAHPLLSAVSWVLRYPSPYLIFGDQAMFVQRADLEAVGGVPQLALMEDAALALKMSRRGKLVRINREVVTSSRRFLERGPLSQLLLDIGLLIRYHLFGQDPERLAPDYQVTSRDEGLPAGNLRVGLGVMAKAPLPGHAKTRLGREVGSDRAAEIYRTILQDLLERFSRLDENIRGVIFAAGERDLRWFKDHYPVWDVRLQEGDDLGERLCRAGKNLFESGADRIFLAAADVPGFQPAHLHRGVKALGDHDLVLGPSPDGGYYLIGMKELHWTVLEGIPWGGSGVLAETLRRAEAAGLSARMLDSLPDIDSRQDWETFQEQHGEDV